MYAGAALDRCDVVGCGRSVWSRTDAGVLSSVAGASTAGAPPCVRRSSSCSRVCAPDGDDRHTGRPTHTARTSLLLGGIRVGRGNRSRRSMRPLSIQSREPLLKVARLGCSRAFERDTTSSGARSPPLDFLSGTRLLRGRLGIVANAGSLCLPKVNLSANPHGPTRDLNAVRAVNWLPVGRR